MGGGGCLLEGKLQVHHSACDDTDHCHVALPGSLPSMPNSTDLPAPHTLLPFLLSSSTQSLFRGSMVNGYIGIVISLSDLFFFFF